MEHHLPFGKQTTTIPRLDFKDLRIEIRQIGIVKPSLSQQLVDSVLVLKNKTRYLSLSLHPKTKEVNRNKGNNAQLIFIIPKDRYKYSTTGKSKVIKRESDV